MKLITVFRGECMSTKLHRTPKEIYALHIKSGCTLERSAEIFETTVAEMIDLLDEGKKELEAFLKIQNYNVGMFRAWNNMDTKYPAQMEALTVARGGLSYEDLIERTGIQASRIQRICKGEFLAYHYEVALIEAATGYDIKAHKNDILGEAKTIKVAKGKYK